MLLRQASSLIFATAVAVLASNARAAVPATAGQLHQFVHSQVQKERDDRFAVLALFPDDTGRDLALALLDKLAAHQAYRDDMQQWMRTVSAPTPEDLAQSWYAHYQKILLNSFELLDDEAINVLWQLKGPNALQLLNRSDCHTLAQQDLKDAVGAARRGLALAQQDKLSTAMAAAYVRQLDRMRTVQPAPMPPGVQTALAAGHFNRLKESLPAADQALLYEAFSYGPPQRTAQRICERNWVASHALSLPHAAAARRNATISSYAGAFADTNRPAQRPLAGGFAPGKAAIYMPTLMSRRGVAGRTEVTVSIDELGKVSTLALTADTLSPALVHSADGTAYKSSDLISFVLGQYYRDGAFPVRRADGVAVPYSLPMSFNWQ